MKYTLLLAVLFSFSAYSQDVHKFVKTGSTFTYQMNNGPVVPYTKVISVYVNPDTTAMRVFVDFNAYILIPKTDTIKISGATSAGNLLTRRMALMTNVFPIAEYPISTQVPNIKADFDGKKTLLDLNQKTDTALLRQKIDSLSNIVNILITDSMQVYNLAGQRVRQKIKTLPFSAVPTTGNGFSVDISAVGFTTILSATVSIEKSTADLASVPMVSIKSISNSAIVVNVYQPTLVVLGGLPNVFTTVFTGIKLHYNIIGY